MLLNTAKRTKKLEQRAGALGRSYAQVRVEEYRAACVQHGVQTSECDTSILRQVYREALEEYVMGDSMAYHVNEQIVRDYSLLYRNDDDWY